MLSTHPRLAALVDAARAQAAAQGLRRVGLVYPCDAAALASARQARDAGIALPVLVGPRGAIEQAADQAAIAIGDLELLPTPDGGRAAAAQAVAEVQRGALAVLMKGSLHTDELMSAVVDRTQGLRGERRISHAFVFDLPRYPKLLALADCVVNIAPDLRTKQDILFNAVQMLRGIGLAAPQVGIVAAVESVNPAIPATLDAQALVGWAATGALGDALVEGPFGFDNAFSAEAARIKNMDSRVAGQADLLLMPDLNAGNMLYKSFVYVGAGDCAGLVLGARVPIVLTSRADSLQARLTSLALAVLTSEKRTP